MGCACKGKTAKEREAERTRLAEQRRKRREEAKVKLEERRQRRTA